MAQDVVTRIARLLDDESPRRRLAAAVVLGALQVKQPQVVSRLVAMAEDPVDAYAEAAVEALGQVGALDALPVLLASLGRGREVSARAQQAIAQLGQEALPAIRKHLDGATPEVRALLSALLPAVGGQASVELALAGLYGQPWEAVNRVALSMRAEARGMSDAQRRATMRSLERFVGSKKTAADEPALRGALKALGFLELPEAQDTLLRYLGAKWPPAVRVEAITALRFALARGPSKKALRQVMERLADVDGLVARAARDTLTVLKLGADFSAELAELCESPDADVSLWAIGHLGRLAAEAPGAAGKLAAKTLFPVAAGADRARAEAASKVLAALSGGDALLVAALAEATEEVGAQVLSEALTPLASKLAAREVKRLCEAGAKTAARSVAVARRQLEPVRAADPEAWAAVLRDCHRALAKKDPARAEAIGQLLGRSAAATPEDRFALAVAQLGRSSMDLHPRARQRDPALVDLERLSREGFKVAEAVRKEKKLSDEARYYVGVHFAEASQFDLKNVGAEVLEGLAQGRTKLAKAAKNKMKLLEL